MSMRPEGWIDYEYAWLMVCPRVHLPRGELVGLILHARRVDYLAMRYRLDEDALATRFPDLDLPDLAATLEGWSRICAGGPGSGPIGLLPPGERFNWLTAPRSAVVRCSEVWGGRAADPAAVLERLLGEAVGPLPPAPSPKTAGGGGDALRHGQR